MACNDIDHRFDHHPPSTPQRVAEHEDARAAAKHFARFLDDHIPEGREKALALTSLEQALFWANAAIARQDA